MAPRCPQLCWRSLHRQIRASSIGTCNLSRGGDCQNYHQHHRQCSSTFLSSAGRQLRSAWLNFTGHMLFSGVRWSHHWVTHLHSHSLSLLCCGQIPRKDRYLVEKATAFHDTSNKKSCFLDFWLLLSNGWRKQPLWRSWQETCGASEEDSQHRRVIWDKSSETPCPLIRRFTLSLSLLAADAIAWHPKTWIYVVCSKVIYLLSPRHLCLTCCYCYQCYSHCWCGPAF